MEIRTVSGILENWEDKKASNNKRYLLCLVAGNKHSFFLDGEKLDKLLEIAPVGTIVEFKEQQNSKGFWNFVEDTFIVKGKDETYNDKTFGGGVPVTPPIDERQKSIVRQSSVKSACKFYAGQTIADEVLFELAEKIENWINR